MPRSSVLLGVLAELCPGVLTEQSVCEFISLCCGEGDWPDLWLWVTRDVASYWLEAHWAEKRVAWLPIHVDLTVMLSYPSGGSRSFRGQILSMRMIHSPALLPETGRVFVSCKEISEPLKATEIQDSPAPSLQGKCYLACVSTQFGMLLGSRCVLSWSKLWARSGVWGEKNRGLVRAPAGYRAVRCCLTL